MSTHLATSIDMADVCSDTGCTPDVIQTQSCDERVGLEEKRQWLTDASASAKDGYFCSAGRRRGKKTSLGYHTAGCEVQHLR